MTLSPEIDKFVASAGWTVPGLLRVRNEGSPNQTALLQLSSDGQWTKSCWNDYCKSVASLANGFRKLGVAPGDRIGIMAANCKEWDYAQLGILAAGGVAIGLDPYGLDEHTQEIARRCNLVGVVLGHSSLLPKLGDDARRNLRFVVCIDLETAPGFVSLGTLMAEDVTGDEWDQARPDAAATIVFTSGTTGAPKGIEYSHRQVCLAISAILTVLPGAESGSRLACWLPLSQLFQRMINLCAIVGGGQIFYVADPREIMRHVPDIAPHVFIGVPRFFEKLQSGIQQGIAKQPAWQQWLARWALQIGDRHARADRIGKRPGPLLKLQWVFAERLVLKKLRGILGGNLGFMISGSAPMPLWLLNWFHSIGLPVLEAYGLSENIIPISMNRPDQFRFGTVGRALPGCDVRLADDGQLLVRGPGVFSGYFAEKSTGETIDGDGFLPTGDFASIDADGFITLIGRKSEIFKTSTGRRVAPASIENLLSQMQQVEYAAVFGAGRTLPTALLVISEAAWQQDRHQLCQRLRAEAAQALAPLPPYLRPAGLAVTSRTFTIAAGDLTANLKLRRHNIATNFAGILNELESHIDNAANRPVEIQSKDGFTLFISL